MKYVITFFLLVNVSAYAQKTTRTTISSMRGISITRSITDADTLFLLMGQNAKYTHITDIVMLKNGTAQDINELLTECMRFLPEKEGTSLEYKGNTMAILGKNVMLFGTGRDQLDYIILSKAVIVKLQTDLQQHL